MKGYYAGIFAARPAALRLACLGSRIL